MLTLNQQLEDDVLAVEDTEGLFKGLDLFLPALDPVLKALSFANAGWLELLIVCEGCIKLLLRAFQINLLLLERLLLILLRSSGVVQVSCFLGLVDFGVLHELIVLLGRFCLSCTGLCLKAGKVRLNDLNHAHNTTTLSTHARVRLVTEDLRFSPRFLLSKGCSSGSLLIEFVQNTERLCDCNLSALSILDSLRVLGILSCTNLGSFSDSGIELGDCLCSFSDRL